MEFMRQGGWMMWPLLIVSVVNLAIILERFWVINATRAPQKLEPHAGVSEVLEAVGKRSAYQAFKETLTAPKPNEKMIALPGQNIVISMERHLSMLDILAKSTTLMGLLGTVSGMIKAFAVIAESTGGVNMTLLAEGLWQALITTATGLIIAIPSNIASAWFRSAVSETAYFLTLAGNIVFDHWSSKSGEEGDPS